MSGFVRVDHQDGDLFQIYVREHALAVGQPTEAGGRDTAPTPTELFVASLASCVAYYARRYLTRHGLATDGLSVEAAYTTADRPARVAHINVLIDVPEGVPDEQRDRLLAVASRCTVHNTLESPPQVDIDLASHPVAMIP